jgi:hypothetical protein
LPAFFFAQRRLELLVRRRPATPLLFRVQALYFRKTTVAEIQILDSTGIAGKALRKELALALESTRSRFAIAIASEKKYTLPVRWQYYMETADRMRKPIRRLRSEKDDGLGLKGLAGALEMLRGLPLHAQAHQLCQTIQEIIAELEV